MVCRVHYVNVGGKSGQHRASRFLTGSCPRGQISVEENNRLVAFVIR